MGVSSLWCLSRCFQHQPRSPAAHHDTQRGTHTKMKMKQTFLFQSTDKIVQKIKSAAQQPPSTLSYICSPLSGPAPPCHHVGRAAGSRGGPLCNNATYRDGTMSPGSLPEAPLTFPAPDPEQGLQPLRCTPTGEAMVGGEGGIEGSSIGLVAVKHLIFANFAKAFDHQRTVVRVPDAYAVPTSAWPSRCCRQAGA